eukprot:TRINITY_DN68571_c0_g1_i1.p1 TRINITY_DN68571_c0_g1~~TRINITY_DN68571_c0_g1_i1.p1  ORF type:complete len:567 (+),score=109.43 TRINITY_DN68571_c0_g1_i1:267-1967(+)
MGAGPCSQVESTSGPPKVKRCSTTSRRDGCGVSVLKPGADFRSTYNQGERVQRDEQVSEVTSIANEVVYVCRTIPKREVLIQASSVEGHLSLLSGLDHVHVCRFVEAFEFDNEYMLIYEKAPSENLFEVDEDLANDRPLSNDKASAYCRQIAMALSVAHKQGFVHGRLSDTSLLCAPVKSDERLLKLCDLGQTFMLRPPRLTGKIEFTAPECLWEELPSSAGADQRRVDCKTYASVDMWAFGVITYRMLTGRSPFFGSFGRKGELKDIIKSEVVNFGEEWADMPDARDALQGLLKSAARIRMTAERLLKHPWLQIEREKLSKRKMMRVLQNVLENSCENNFKKFALRVIAEDMPAEKLDIVQKAFRLIDKNGDGNLEVGEVRDALKRFGEEEDAAEEIFEAIDRDSSGTLNLAEFSAVSIGRSEYCCKEVLWHAFHRFDKDESGLIDRSKIERVWAEVENVPMSDEVARVVDEMAQDVELPVDFDYFVHSMTAPVGQPLNVTHLGIDRCCHTVLKVDTHKVRHIVPGSRVTKANPFQQTPFMKGGRGCADTDLNVKWPSTRKNEEN